MTGVDLNRAGTPLIEIVSEPDMRSVDEAVCLCQDHSRTGYMAGYPVMPSWQKARSVRTLMCRYTSQTRPLVLAVSLKPKLISLYSSCH